MRLSDQQKTFRQSARGLVKGWGLRELEAQLQELEDNHDGSVLITESIVVLKAEIDKNLNAGRTGVPR